MCYSLDNLNNIMELPHIYYFLQSFKFTRVLHCSFQGKMMFRTSQWHTTISHSHPLLHQDRVLHSIYLLVFVEEAEQRSDKLETIFTVSEIVQADSFWIF